MGDSVPPKAPSHAKTQSSEHTVFEQLVGEKADGESGLGMGAEVVTVTEAAAPRTEP